MLRPNFDQIFKDGKPMKQAAQFGDSTDGVTNMRMIEALKWVVNSLGNERKSFGPDPFNSAQMAEGLGLAGFR